MGATRVLQRELVRAKCADSLGLVSSGADHDCGMSRSTGVYQASSTRGQSPLLPVHAAEHTPPPGIRPLAGRPWKSLRVVFVGLAARLPYGSAQGTTTIEQVAVAAGYSMRRPHQCLTGMEDLGLLEWTRGGPLRAAHTRGSVYQ